MKRLLLLFPLFVLTISPLPSQVDEDEFQPEQTPVTENEPESAEVAPPPQIAEDQSDGGEIGSEEPTISEEPESGETVETDPFLVPSLVGPAGAAGDSLSAGVSGGSETISIDFPDEEIRRILRSVADLYDLNLVIPDTLIGRASIRLNNVTWQQAFEVLLSPVRHTFQEENGIVKIVSYDALQAAPRVMEIFPLNHARATELIGVVQSIAPGAQIQAYRRNNALVISDTRQQLDRIQELVIALDIPSKQVVIETKFIEVRDEDLRNIGVNWASLAGYNLGASAEHGYFRDASRESTDGRSSTGSQSSQSTSTSSQSSQSGGAPTSGRSVTATGTVSQSNSVMDSITNLTSSGNITNAVFTAPQFNVILSALRATTDARLVSNPTVVATNGDEAVVKIVEHFKIQEPGALTQGGGQQPGSIIALDPLPGITLTVTPQISGDDLITLQVKPEVNSIVGMQRFENQDVPTVRERSTTSLVTLRNGQTLAIGGLIDSSDINSKTRVPVLGSLPGIGRLFRHDGRDSFNSNMIIFITARILDPETATYLDTVDDQRLDDLRVTPDDLPGRPTRLDPAPFSEAFREDRFTQEPIPQENLEPPSRRRR